MRTNSKKQPDSLESHEKIPTKPRSKAKHWTRPAEDSQANQIFGDKLKALRTQRKLLLADVAKEVGLPAATLSRIENNKLSPTYPVVMRLLEFFRLDWLELMPSGEDAKHAGFLSASRDGNEVAFNMKTARRIYPHGANLPLPIQSIILEISGQRSADFKLFGHAGFEHCFVISGTLRFHSRDRAPIELKQGESLLFNSSIPHAYVSANGDDVRLLIVTTFKEGGPSSTETLSGFVTTKNT